LTPIAIVGVGCRFPEPPDRRRSEPPTTLAPFWDDLIGPGATAFDDIPKERWAHEPLYSPSSRDVDKAWVRKGSFIRGWKDFAALHYGIAPRRLEVMDPQQRLLIEATRWAIQDAGYETRAFDRERTGTFFGVSVSEFKNVAGSRLYAMQLANGDFGPAAGSQELRDAMMEMASNVAPMRAFTLPGSLLNMNAASVAQTFDFGGPAYTIDAACASSSVAIHDAIWMLRAGMIDVGLAGGVYVNLGPDNLIAFTKIGAISPSGACRPFDEKADGFVQSDAVAVFFLKRLDDAVADGDRILGVIIGSGCNNDGRGEGPMTPRVDGQLRALRLAYRDAGVSPASVAYFEAHGTATSIGDPAEVEALGTLLAEAGVTKEAPAPIGSVKGNIGHAMSAAGVAGLAKALAMIERRAIPPHAGFDRINAKLGFDRFPLVVPSEARPLEPRPNAPLRIGVSSFGFGGTNSHLIVEEPPRSARSERTFELDRAPLPEAVLVTAPTLALLQRHARSLADAIESSRPSLADVAYTLNARRSRERIRAVVGARTLPELVEQLRKLAGATEVRSLSKDLQIHDASEGAPKVAFLFPGQGAQKVGLLQGARERFAAFRDAFGELEASAADVLGRPLSAWLYPAAPGDDAEGMLARTEICQPAMAAIGLAMASLLERSNVWPAVSLGHSLGEFSAMASGRMIEPRALVRFVAERGLAMQALELADAGAMAAVMADAGTVAGAIAGIEGVAVANFNHPRQVSISGTTAGVRAAEDRLAARGVEAKRLNVSHAFHSPVLEGVRPAVDALSRGLALSPPRHAVASCIREGLHSSDPREALQVISDHATAPVEFVRGLEVARAAGATVFVQLGGSMLTSFARATLGAEVTTIAISGDADDGYDVVRALATCAALGVPVDFEPVYAGEGRRVVTLPETPLERQEYWVVKDQPQPKPELSAPRDGRRTVDAVTVPAQRGDDAPADLVTLFRTQAAILEKHAEIIAAQNRLLLGGSAPSPLAAVREMAAPAPNEPPPPVALPPPKVEVEAGPSGGARDGVVALVAKISAFPEESIKAEQKLVDELGFDSLMVADLAAGLAKAFPQRGELPASMFSLDTTVGDLVRAVSSAERHRASEPAPVAAPLSIYRVVPRARPRGAMAPHSVAGETWLLTEDESSLSSAVGTELERLGARVFRVRLVEGGVAAPSKLALGSVNVWPAAYVEGLCEALGGARLDGFVHGSGLGVSNVSDFVNPVRLLHPIVSKLSVPRIAILTSLGGRLGLEAGLELSKNVLQAALTGYTKALARERTNAVVRAIDVGPKVSGAEVVEEILAADQPVEVGLGAERVIPEITALEPGPVSRTIGKADVVLISGGAGELGATLAHHVASKGPKAIILLGRRREDDRIRKLLAALGDRTRASYASADVTDAGAVITATRSLLDKVGHPTIVIHAAGAIEDGPASKKSIDSVDRVMNVKVRGLQALLRAFPRAKDFVLFTSWAGRFGNAGQVDYSAANALLDHVAIAGIGAARVVAVAWPPWSSTAMVATIPEPVKRAMKLEGVTFLEDAEGLAAFDRIFESGAAGLRVVGRDLPSFETRSLHLEAFDLDRHPYLDDHRLKGRPVVPLASATDLLAWAFTETVDGAGALAIEGLDLLRGLYAGDRAEVQVLARRSAAGSRATAQIRCDQVAYRAKLSTGSFDIAGFELGGEKERASLTLDEFYAKHTFHGPRLRGIEKVRKVTPDGIEGVVRPAPIAAFLPGTARAAWSIDPLILDGSFQLAAYWLAIHHGRVGFPIGFDRLTVLRRFEAQPVVCRLRVRSIDRDQFAGDIFYTDDLGTPYALLEGIRGKFAEVFAPVEPAIDVPAENVDIAAFPEVEQLDQRFQMAELMGLRNPYFHVHAGTARNTSVVDGVEMLNFSSYNYLGYSGHPEVVAAAKEAIEKYGTSVSASRVASGERPIHRELEIGLAGHVGVEDAIVYVSGHATNVTTIGHLLGEQDLIVHDSLIHDSILQGVHLSGAVRRPYPHGDLDALEDVLSKVRKSYRRALICAEGIYSMDGDFCDLPRLIELKKRYKALLLVDEAHSIGVLGPSGRGVGHHFDGVDPKDVDLWMGTLSKSFASCGGYIAGSKALVRYLKYTAPGFVYSAGITPPNAAAALKSLELMHREPETVERLRKRSRYFLEGAKRRGIDTGLAMGAAVVPAIVGNSLDCMRLSEALAAKRINVQPIVYPAVEDDASRLRFFVSALHTEEQLDRTLDTVRDELHRIRSGEAASVASAPSM
jgi:8-amino-7-oxononanoate synthase